MNKWVCGIFVFSLGVLGYVNAQVVSPLNEPIELEPVVQPFEYPDIFSSPQFTLEQAVSNELLLGTYTVRLGKTRLSQVTSLMGGELYHLPNRRDFLCYSAPLAEKKLSSSEKKARAKLKIKLREPQEGSNQSSRELDTALDKITPTQEPKEESESADPTHQNIWLFIGKRGEINEARLQEVPPGGLLCTPLPPPFDEVSFGPFKIGQTPREQRSLKLPPVSEKNEESQWFAWFSESDPEDQIITFDLLGIHLNELGDIERIIALEAYAKEGK